MQLRESRFRIFIYSIFLPGLRKENQLPSGLIPLGLLKSTNLSKPVAVQLGGILSTVLQRIPRPELRAVKHTTKAPRTISDSSLSANKSSEMVAFNQATPQSRVADSSIIIQPPQRLNTAERRMQATAGCQMANRIVLLMLDELAELPTGFASAGLHICGVAHDFGIHCTGAEPSLPPASPGLGSENRGMPGSVG